MSDTLVEPAAFELEVRHSRFLARACAVASPEAALDWLAEVAVAEATHNCWAYRIGTAYRSSDDGEPSGTAGRPILAAIDGQDCDRVMVVVTRWYGGIKLGAGGLARAYGGGAAECLRGARRQPIVAQARLAIQAGFEDIGAVHAALAAFAADKREESFRSDGVRLRVELPLDQAVALADQLRDATRGRATVACEDRDD